jgi:hypothetical protein
MAAEGQGSAPLDGLLIHDALSGVAYPLEVDGNTHPHFSRSQDHVQRGGGSDDDLAITVEPRC